MPTKKKNMASYIDMNVPGRRSREREREISFVEFYLSSLTCYHFVRGFSLWTAVLIADGVVLAKYLVTEDERWVSGGS